MDLCFGLLKKSAIMLPINNIFTIPNTTPVQICSQKTQFAKLSMTGLISRFFWLFGFPGFNGSSSAAGAGFLSATGSAPGATLDVSAIHPS
jgi:hypothetical protein